MNRRTEPRRHLASIFLTGLLIFASSLPLVSCSRVVERRTEPTPVDLAGSQTLDQRKRYVSASIEIACMTRRETDPNRIAAATLVIYRRYGFEDVMSYLALVETVGQEKAVQQELADGLKSCP